MQSNPFVPIETRHPYYVVTPPYESMSAGIRDLHLLCHWLNRFGYPAFISPFYDAKEKTPRTLETRQDLITPVLTGKITNAHVTSDLTPIIVYPEVISGNPHKVNCVVRWLLNYPGRLGGDKTFDDKEMIFAFSQSIADTVPNTHGVLYMPAVDTSIFFQKQEVTQRKGSCFYAYKYRVSGRLPFGLPPDCIEILNWTIGKQPLTQVADLFCRCDKFYIFEDTALSLEAGLCGCPTIVMKSDFLQYPVGCKEYGGAGIALDNTPEEIARAQTTVGRVPEIHSIHVERFWRQFDVFIAATQNKASKGN